MSHDRELGLRCNGLSMSNAIATARSYAGEGLPSMEYGPLNRMTETTEVLKSGAAPAGRHFCGAHWLLELEGYIACFAITSAAGLELVFRSSTHARRVRRATFSLQRRISSSRLFERKVCIMGRARQ